MPYENVPTYWAELEGARETIGRLALMFLISTGARSTEVREARWRHVDRDKGEWARPAELMRKSDQLHVVTLNAPALDILNRISACSDSNNPDALIFANRKGTMISDMTISKVMRDGDLPWVPHGFRTSLRTWATEQQPYIPEAVAESALSHVITTKWSKPISGRHFSRCGGCCSINGAAISPVANGSLCSPAHLRPRRRPISIGGLEAGRRDRTPDWPSSGRTRIRGRARR